MAGVNATMLAGLLADWRNGGPAERQLAATVRRFTARGLPTTSEQILVVSGALQALDLTVRAMLRRGRVAVAEIPSYPAALDVLRAAGARVRTVPIGPGGWDLEQLRV